MTHVRYPLMRNNIAREDLDAVIAHLRQDDPCLTQGAEVRAFEAEWSAWLGVRHSVFVNSGASANLLTMSLLRRRYPDGGEVIVPPLTWVSDIASVLQHGFTPVFVDIDRRTLAMQPDGILDRLTAQTRAVFLTHVQGFDGLTDRLVEELDRRGVPLIEDVCESHGATHAGRKLGTFGWISNFSFYYAHHLSTIEGGMICTDDPDVYQRALMLRSHGMVRAASDPAVREAYHAAHPDLTPDFIFAAAAYNVRNTEIGGIIGRHQLRRLDANVARRTANLRRFLSRLDATRFRTDFELTGASSYAFNAVLRQPDHALAARVMQAMREAGIEFRRGSSGGGNQLRQPYLAGLVDADAAAFPETEHVHFFGFYLGNYPDLRDVDIDSICAVLNGA